MNDINKMHRQWDRIILKCQRQCYQHGKMEAQGRISENIY